MVSIDGRTPVTPRSRKIAAYLHQLRRDGGCIEELPADVRPTARPDAYAAQACLEAFSAHPLFGWKIAATSRAGQEHIRVGGPLAGRLFAENAFPCGTEISLAGNRMRVAEGEFAFRIGQDLAPRPHAYTREEVAAAVAALYPAIEVPNSRFAPFEAAGEAQLIADNACAEYFVLGARAPEHWRDIDLAGHAVSAMAGDGTLHRGLGRNVLGHPLDALAWIANELSSLGVTLKAGQVVTTGTCFTPFGVRPGDRISVDFGVLGRVEARFAVDGAAP
ncbi:MAG: fumarylacetoacetate hydrolase family protein [Burkholderiales bacterium]|nr:fumarylacetoacetate hydrolase family protein [Burkholderiales bacterium]